jgi:hypothetical protein
MGPVQTIEGVSLISIVGRPQNNSLKLTVTHVTPYAGKGKARATLRRLNSTVPHTK